MIQDGNAKKRMLTHTGLTAVLLFFVSVIVIMISRTPGFNTNTFYICQYVVYQYVLLLLQVHTFQYCTGTGTSMTVSVSVYLLVSLFLFLPNFEPKYTHSLQKVASPSRSHFCPNTMDNGQYFIHPNPNGCPDFLVPFSPMLAMCCIK